MQWLELKLKSLINGGLGWNSRRAGQLFQDLGSRAFVQVRGRKNSEIGKVPHNVCQ